MQIFSYEVCPAVIKAVLIGGTLALIGAITVLKIYLYLTLGICRSKKRMDGKTVIVTGASGGIGKETALELAKRGARVVMACRNISASQPIRDEIAAAAKNENVILRKLDLASQQSIRDFAEEIIRNESRLDVLIHNAGTAESKTTVTEDGLELTMATNHFGPFLLTHLLIDLLKKSAPSRVVVVASELYRLASINFDKINPVNTYIPPYQYYVSKYANICFTRELARRLEGTRVTANCLHPGLIDSGIWRNVPAPFSWPLKLIIKGFFKTTQQGCQTTIHLAASEEVEGITGKYFMDCKERDISSGAKDDYKAKKLWEVSEKLSNLKNTDPRI